MVQVFSPSRNLVLRMHSKEEADLWLECASLALKMLRENDDSHQMDPDSPLVPKEQRDCQCVQPGDQTETQLDCHHQHASFVPVREEQKCFWYVDGSQLFEAVASVLTHTV